MNSEEDEFNRIELEASMRNKGITLGFTKPIESSITFMTSAGKEVMRIDKNGVKINPDFSLDEAAQHVINAMDGYIKGLVQAEREACAKVCESRMTPGTGSVAILNGAAAAIRARGEASIRGNT